MDPLLIILIISAVIILGLAIGGSVALLRDRGTEGEVGQQRPGVDYTPGVGDDATEPRDTPRKTIETVEVGSVLDEPTDVGDAADLALWEVEIPEPAAGRLSRLRARLARSNNVFGKSLLSLLSSGNLDAEAWEDIEATLLGADLGVSATTDLMQELKVRIAASGDSSPEFMRRSLKEALLELVNPHLHREVARTHGERPAVILVVGVNGTGKTTTVGKLSRVLIAEDNTVVLAAADTFRAAAAEQLQTWGDRVGAAVVRGPEGGDPASVAFEAVTIAQQSGVDALVVDTAGRLHTKTGLMDELGKVKRVIEKQSPVDEVLLVIDATTGQNGLVQAKVFSEVVDVTGIVLTKLDGTAKGGIVVAVQRELGVPVKLVGLGEGPDDLAPFDPEAFVEALIS
ncbi:MAG: signal recognition particle-docking protein FtsY [Candidatus Nanopelagicales bacterium]|nr:signal recognition particle-docking protein FtsY [Candidatus Nanopelagicales bacterium]